MISQHLKVYSPTGNMYSHGHRLYNYISSNESAVKFYDDLQQAIIIITANNGIILKTGS